MKKVIFYVPDSLYGYEYHYYHGIAMYLNRNYPIDAQIVGNYGIMPQEIEEELKAGALAIFVDGMYLDSENSMIYPFLEKYKENILFWYRSSAYKCLQSIELLKNNKVAVSFEDDVEFLKKNYGISATYIPTAMIGMATDRDYSCRVGDVLFFGTYYSPKNMKDLIFEETPELLKGYLEEVLSEIGENRAVPVEVIIEKVLKKYAKKNIKGVFLEILKQYGSLLEDYRDGLFKEKIVRKLIKNRLVVHAVGNGWDSLKKEISKNSERFIIKNIPVGVESISPYATNAMFVMSTNIRKGVDTNFCEGLMAGCTALVLDTDYNKKNIGDNLNVYFYDIDSDAIVDMIRDMKSKKNPKPIAIPEKNTMEYVVDEFLTVLSGKDWKEQSIKAVKKNLINRKGFSYINTTNGNAIVVIGSDLSYISKHDLKRKYAPNTVRVAVVSGIDNPMEALRKCGTVMPYRLYIIPNDYKRANAIMEEFGLDKVYKKYINIFETAEKLEEYLIANDDEFLPRIYIGDEERFKLMTAKLHKMRIHSKRSSKVKPIISISMPSLNRGENAYRAVRKLLLSEFDSEIEFVVAANVSTVNLEGYEKIKRIKDSRLRFSQAKEYTTFDRSITRAIKLTKGQYTLIQSDEDEIFVKALPYYMDVAVEYPNISFFVVSGKGENGHVSNFQGMDSDKVTNIYRAMNMTYVTGLFVNRKLLKDEYFESVPNKYKGNMFYTYYAHLIYLLIMANKGPVFLSFVPLYKCLKTETRKEGLLELNDVKTRIDICEASIDIILNEVSLSQEDLVRVLVERLSWPYYIMCVAYNVMGDILNKNGRTIENDIETIDQWVEEYLPSLRQILNEDYYEDLHAMIEEKRNETLKDYDKMLKVTKGKNKK